MRRVLYILISAMLMWSCEDKYSDHDANISIDMVCPEGINQSDIYNLNIVFNSQSLGQTYRYDNANGITIAKDMYVCSINANIKIDGTELDLHGRKNMEISEDKTLSVNLYLSGKSEDLIFEEIFITGTRYESGTNYAKDKYFKLYNNTDHTIYADGVALLESRFKSNNMIECTPDIKESHFATCAVYVIPGSGNEHPVEPGQSIILCDIGIDHRTVNANSFDLSKGDYEWFDMSSHASNQDIDSDIENLDKWCCYTNTIYIPNVQCLTTFALARMKTSSETFVVDNVYNYTYLNINSVTGTTVMTGEKTWKVPNEWIIDAVSFGYDNEYQWCPINEKHERGHVQMGAYKGDVDKYFKSARRKMLSINEDGTRLLKDTNNSTDDFNANVVPSLIEEQQTSIDTKGTKATTKTYDGVTPIR